MAKRVLPADRLCYFRLEDGLGWEQLCPFLDLPIPDEPFPSAFVQEDFKRAVGELLRPRVRGATLTLAAVAVPVLGLLAHLGFKYHASSKLGL